MKKSELQTIYLELAQKTGRNPDRIIVSRYMDEASLSSGISQMRAELRLYLDTLDVRFGGGRIEGEKE